MKPGTKSATQILVEQLEAELATIRAQLEASEAREAVKDTALEKVVAQLNVDYSSGIDVDDPHYPLYWAVKDALASSPSTLLALRKAAREWADNPDGNLTPQELELLRAVEADRKESTP